MSMTTDDVIQVCRRAMEEVDTSTSDITDEEILAAASDERDILELQQVSGYTALSIGYDQTDETTYGILPEASLTLELGTILALRAAAALLRRRYRDQVRRGEIGVSWTSGLESETTLAAGKDYQTMIKDLDELVTRLILVKRRSDHGWRVQ